MTDWTRADDLIIGVAFKETGLAVTEPLMAALPQHDAGSIRMRLQNFQWLASGGQHGLYKVTESTRWAHDVLVSLMSHLPIAGKPLAWQARFIRYEARRSPIGCDHPDLARNGLSYSEAAARGINVARSTARRARQSGVSAWARYPARGGVGRDGG